MGEEFEKIIGKNILLQPIVEFIIHTPHSWLNVNG
jgi:hypothetical protein